MASDYGFGVSFLPNGDTSLKRPGGPTSSVVPLQEAIKVLSLRMPRVVGASPLAPLALLQGRGGGGLPEGMLQQLLRTMGQVPETNPGGIMAGPGQIGIQGASSPFASPEGPRPTLPEGYLGGYKPAGGGAPLNMPSMTVGASTKQGLPIDGPPQTPMTGAPLPQDPAQDLWDLAQRQREGMGRIAY